MRVLIIGSGGQDGRLLYERFAREGAAVLGVESSRIRAEGVPVPQPVDITRADAVDTIVREFRPDRLFYVAAFHHSSEERQPESGELFKRSFDVNVNGLVHCLEAIRRHSPATRLFYAASSRVFGHPATPLQDESTPFAPTCIYGITKAAGVQCCRLYRDTHGVHAATGILYNHESSYRPGRFVSRKIVLGAVAIRRGEASELTLGDLEARIDWGYAPDTVDAMVRILDHDRPDDFVVATGEAHSVGDFVRVTFERLGLDWKDHVKVKADLVTGRRPALVGNATRLRQATGWRPTVRFDEMIDLLLEAEGVCHETQ